MTKILVVCMGNICRSPLAEAVLRKRISDAGLDGMIDVESAGTHGYHAGEEPDSRARAVGVGRGYDFGAKRARKVSPKDYEKYDWILAMDRANLEHLERKCPMQHRAKLALFLQFAGLSDFDEVADPYYGNTAGFERTVDLCERAADGLIRRILNHGTGTVAVESL